jgi:DNA segregation ATPase FtsK/SpoIIIE-like protein
MGDMLYFPMSSPHPIRLQGAFVNEDEVERITDLLRKTYGANYDDEVAGKIESCELRLDPEAERRILSDTELFNTAVDKVFENGYASVSVLQRELGIGYPAAARLIDRLEKERIIGPFEDGKPRQILITEEEWNNRRNNNE